MCIVTAVPNRRILSHPIRREIPGGVSAGGGLVVCVGTAASNRRAVHHLPAESLGIGRLTAASSCASALQDYTVTPSPPFPPRDSPRRQCWRRLPVGCANAAVRLAARSPLFRHQATSSMCTNEVMGPDRRTKKQKHASIRTKNYCVVNIDC